MKKILPFALAGLPICLMLATACSSNDSTATIESADPAQTAVSAFIRKNADDPISYQPVRFGKAEPFTRSDSAYAAAAKLMKSNIRTERDKGYALVDGAGKDTATQLGTRFIHAFRAKNKLGALVLDSAQFVVYKNGQVAAY